MRVASARQDDQKLSLARREPQRTTSQGHLRNFRRPAAPRPCRPSLPWANHGRHLVEQHTMSPPDPPTRLVRQKATLAQHLVKWHLPGTSQGRKQPRCQPRPFCLRLSHQAVVLLKELSFCCGSTLGPLFQLGRRLECLGQRSMSRVLPAPPPSCFAVEETPAPSVATLICQFPSAKMSPEAVAEHQARFGTIPTASPYLPLGPADFLACFQIPTKCCPALLCWPKRHSPETVALAQGQPMKSGQTLGPAHPWSMFVPIQNGRGPKWA